MATRKKAKKKTAPRFDDGPGPWLKKKTTKKKATKKK
jgi:hypothetical protein